MEDIAGGTGNRHRGNEHSGIHSRAIGVDSPVEVDPGKCEPPLRPDMRGGWDLSLQVGELPQPLDWTKVFGRPAPVEIEVGSGSGVFISHEAARRPEVNFFAIEMDGKQVKRARDKWRRRSLLNTRIVRCDALHFLERFPPDHSVERMHVLFSDPWPKQRHHKRRFFQPRLLPILDRVLTSGGELIVKTDVTDYFEVIHKLLSSAEHLREEDCRRLDEEPLPDDIVTNYQRKAMEKGHPLHYLRYRKL